jgi:hypothetical protein
MFQKKTEEYLGEYILINVFEIKTNVCRYRQRSMTNSNKLLKGYL